MQIINFWCFTLNRIDGLDLPAEVPFHSFVMWALKGPVLFGKVLGLVCKKRLNCAQKYNEALWTQVG